jgi:RelA/SpoT family (p)ppGpp synthetase
VLERELKRARGNQKEFVGKIAETFKSALKKAQIAGGVEGREKHLYSIYRKMQTKHISLNEMVDVYGFRIIVDSPDTCYRVLGLVHSVYKPMPGRFKDYIAIPRVNGYQSLHTTLFGPNGVPIEVQIRSEQMHRVAESGIAAHWKYKSGGDTFGGVEHDRAREWLAGLVQIQEGGSSEEFLESVKVDLFPDKVYVFTPKGKILRLPTGATAVDFAYAIHTDIGNRCVAAKVDRRLVPLRTPLRNGQTVEIITAKGATPNPSWSSFLVTAKARAAIRQYLKNLKRSEAVELGRRLLGLALEEFSLSLKKIAPADLDAVVKELNLKDADELFEKIGLGERLAPLVARRLQPAHDVPEAELTASGPLMIAGTEGLLVTYAHCCFPIPNDPIMAYLSAGRGVMIHRQNCGNLAEYRKQPEKWLSVAWEETHGRLFTSEIQLEINNRVGVLAAVASSIAETETNIDQVQLEERDVSNSWLRIQLQVRDRKHLAQVIKTVRRMPDVQRVFRTLA